MLNWIVWNRTIWIKMDLALNNLQRLICHKTQPTIQLHVLYIYIYNLLFLTIIISINIMGLFTYGWVLVPRIKVAHRPHVCIVCKMKCARTHACMLFSVYVYTFVAYAKQYRTCEEILPLKSGAITTGLLLKTTFNRKLK